MIQLGRLLRDLREGAQELELVVGSGRRLRRERPQLRGDRGEQLVPVVRSRVRRGRDGELRERVAEGRRLVLGRDVVEHEARVVAGADLAVARRVPDRGEHERARERVLERGEVPHGDLERRGIQADLRVGEVVVVQQHERGALAPDELGDLGAVAVDVELEALRADQLRVAELVEADGEAVRAERRVVLRGLLQDGERRDGAVLVRLDLWTQRVDAGGLQPQVGPALEVAAARALELRREVPQRRVAERVALEVGGHTGEELVLADVGDELAEHRRALGVRDAVEVDLHVLQVVDGRVDRVGAGELVLVVGPRLLAGVERGPGARPLGALGRGQGRDVGREGLVEPQVVPPLHGDQVAEPHVRELVQDRRDPALLHGVGDLGAEHVALDEGHGARVLHRARVELGDEQLVVLRERVRVVEALLVEREALAGLLEHVVGVEVLHERLAGEDAERDRAAVARGELAADDAVRARDERRDVARHAERRLEGPRGRAVGCGRGLGRGGVGDDLPVRGSRDREAEDRLEVGLLEHREHAAGVRHLELRVQVDLVVDGIDEPVQALARVRVHGVGDDRELVLLREVVEADPHAVADGGGVELAAVEGHGVDRAGDRVDERGRARRGGEAHGRGGSEHLRAPGEVERHVVLGHGQQRGALLGLDAGEVLSWHGAPARP